MSDTAEKITCAHVLKSLGIRVMTRMPLVIIRSPEANALAIVETAQAQITNDHDLRRELREGKDAIGKVEDALPNGHPLRRALNRLLGDIHRP